MRRDNEILREIEKIEKRRRIKKEIKEFIKNAPYQSAIILIGLPFLIYYTLK
jgi:hypothetical protein